MNKNILIRAVSMMLVAGVLLASFGCKKGEEAPTTTTTTAEGEVVLPSVENGTFKVEVTIHDDEEGTTKVEEKTNELFYINIMDSLDNTSENMKNYIIEKSGEWGIDEAKAKEMVKSGTTWMYVQVHVYVLNSKSKPVTMKYVNVGKQTESLIVDTALESEFGIPSGGGEYVTLDTYIDTSKYETEEDIIATLQSMDIKIAYAVIEDMFDTVDDWSSVTTAYIPF